MAESSNLNKYLFSSSSSKWVIDFGATDHMTGNSSLFSTFHSQPSTSTITLAYGSQSCVLGSGIIFPTPSLPLSSVLSLPNFSFNLMYVKKLTRALKCYISFFLDFCLFLDLMTKQIIGRGRESRGLYILDHTISKTTNPPYGVDYSETFSIVAKMTYVRLFISMAATYNWDVHQLDIKIVFLHGNL